LFERSLAQPVMAAAERGQVLTADQIEFDYRPHCRAMSRDNWSMKNRQCVESSRIAFF
jgi:hypothetical protein